MSSRSRSDATELETFIRQCHDALADQVQGNSGPFLELWSHADDFTILGAIGSYARGCEDVKAHIQGAAKTLNWTRLAVEPIVTTAARGLGVSVTLERMTRGKQDARTLKATQAYRHEGGQWRLILRHANTVSAEDESREQSLLAVDRTRR
jgi:ketosteroid isomerase-like protein